MNENAQRETLVQQIIRRLERDESVLKARFATRQGSICARHCVIDGLLGGDLAAEIYRCFPEPGVMRRMTTFRERKHTFKALDAVPPLLKNVTFAFQDVRVVACVERITGIPEQRPDASLYAGGISLMTRGDFLNPHIDNSHDETRRYYRTLNLLYYVAPGWRVEYGGNLELWDSSVTERLTVPSLFDRLVIMETHPRSWHSVSPVAHDGSRCCVSNYYFSPDSPEGLPYFNVTSFSARPEQPVRRFVARLDGIFRNALRKVVRSGLGKSDTYTPKT